MKELTLAVIGALGFGRALVDEIKNNAAKNHCRLKAIVDISPKAKEAYPELVETGVRFYKTMEEMYSDMDIDIVLIASPIQFHAQQACIAMENGSHVMLEKPIAGSIDDVEDIIQAQKDTGKHILIGFQLCYDETIRKVKETILSGELGGMHTMKCIVLWPRNEAYFSRNSWAGIRYDKEGKAVFDSVANNATAHFFMNLMYLSGEDMDSASTIEEIDVRLYRANPIETFDTCVMKAILVGGIEFIATVSHATEQLVEPQYELIFDYGKIISIDNEWIVEANGERRTIGKSNHSIQKKIWDMANYVRDTRHTVKCTIDCAIEHTKLIEMLDEYEVQKFNKNVVLEDARIYIKNLGEILIEGYEKSKLNFDLLDTLC
ncbi:MAG: Gfo/Idh/MocA family oxidoreductase [Clostridiales bacterium]|nr:Gfo/Idh/MocA family oxidoreductase [Clostridiales bacterium]